ncbi:hypothetical protein [Xanthovirga aplysinae]|uniref:hypothetical protein n=1 Tax=Xanthovirga aplysinae TaxID=2529853 RepID=UPI0012BB697C|nr:hypothetical protein [Xanthovirga aplysinae]
MNLDKIKRGNTIITSVLHFESMVQTLDSLKDVPNGMGLGITNDFLAMDIRHALHHFA